MNTLIASNPTLRHADDITIGVKKLKQSFKMRASTITNQAEQEAAELQAYQAVRDQFNELSESFSIFMACRHKPASINDHDCSCVILDAEELIRRVKAFQQMERRCHETNSNNGP